MLFTFKCRQCGEYSVDENTFKAFITPELQTRLSQRPNAVKAKLAFESGPCPKCPPTIELSAPSQVKLSVFSPKVKLTS